MRISMMRVGRNTLRSTRVANSYQLFYFYSSVSNPFSSVVEYFTRVKSFTFSLRSGPYADWADPMPSPGDLQRIVRVPSTYRAHMGVRARHRVVLVPTHGARRMRTHVDTRQYA